MNENLRVLLSGEFNVHLVFVSGTNAQGLPIHAFVAVQEKNLPAFNAAQAQQGFKPEDHGTVLANGFGKTPPPFLRFETIEKFESGEWQKGA